MGFLVLLVLLGLPLAEIWVMIEVGQEIGALSTIALIVGTAAVGVLLFRIQGVATLARVQDRLDRGEAPVGELLSGLGLLVAGVLLLIPGFVTDVIGLLLFVPPLRRLLVGAGLAWAMARGTTRIWTVRPGPGGAGPPRGPQQPGGGAPGGGKPGSPGPVIEGDFQDVTTPGPGDDRPRLDDERR